MVSQPSKRLTFEIERPVREGGPGPSATSPPSAPPPTSSTTSSSLRRPPHLQPIPSSPQTPPRPILIPPTSPTAPAPTLQTPTRARTHHLPDHFLANLRNNQHREQHDPPVSPAAQGPSEHGPHAPAAPQFAEQLSTPWRRPKRSRAIPELILPQTDQDGFYDETEGDLYRGPGPSSPRPTPNRRFRYDTSGRELDEDAITLRSVSSKSSSSSSSTDASVMSRSRRKVVGALRGLGVLGSDYSRSSSESSDEEDQVGGGTDLQRRKSFSRKLKHARRKKRGRAWSFGRSSTTGSSSSSSDDEPLGRRKVTGRREFVLLLPPPPAQDPPLPTFLSPSTPAASTSRVVRTPYLPDVLKEITTFRDAFNPAPPPRPSRAQSRNHIPPRPTSLRSSSRPVTPAPMTPRKLLNASLLPTLPAPSHDPTQRRPPVPVSAAGAKRFQPPSIPMPSASGHALFPSTPQPSPPASGSSTPTSYFQEGGGLPRVVIEGPTPAGTPKLEARPKPTGKDSTKAWWLDINCPTWEDMRSIGELFSLHPLTLEDILHQDPREKLETFDSLGYYLITFRAVDESYFKYTDEPSSAGTPSILSPDMPPVDPSLGPTNPDLPGNPSKNPVLITSSGGASRGAATKSGKGRRRGRVEIQEDRPGKEGLEGVGVGAVNVYLVVFRDGIISFHFDDISKHTQGVMDRLLSLEDGRTLTSDWIAHGLMDSIVDSFFPLIDYVEFEADDIDGKIVHHDELVDFESHRPPSSSPSPSPDAPPGFALQHQPSQTSSDLARLKLGRDSDSFSAENQPSEAYEMKNLRFAPSPPSPPRGPRHFIPPALIVLFYTSLSHFLLFVRLHPSQVHARRQRARMQDPHRRFRTTHDFDRGQMLKRMTDTRRLITGLSRLLIPKSEVVGRLRKRAEEVAGRRMGSAYGLVGGDMVTYIGDVQDHILSMQATLLHSEQILAQAQPAYVSQLRVSAAVARGITDSSILKLSVVAIGVLPMQFVSGMFSMNVNSPRNGDREHLIKGYPNNVFGCVVAAVIVVACVVITSVRHLKKQAFLRRKALEGGAIA